MQNGRRLLRTDGGTTKPPWQWCLLKNERPYRLPTGRAFPRGGLPPSPVAWGRSAQDGPHRLPGQNPGGYAANDLCHPGPLNAADRDDVHLGSTNNPAKDQQPGVAAGPTAGLVLGAREGRYPDHVASLLCKGVRPADWTPLTRSLGPVAPPALPKGGRRGHSTFQIKFGGHCIPLRPPCVAVTLTCRHRTPPSVEGRVGHGSVISEPRRRSGGGTRLLHRRTA